MVIFYVLPIAYILAINFYAFILVKTLKREQTERELKAQTQNPTSTPLQQGEDSLAKNISKQYVSKLIITGALGGAITVYVCMFIFKFRVTDLLLMVVMPLLAVLNVYMWVLIFRSGIPMLILR